MFHCVVLWDVFGECRNYNVLEGHKNAVLQVKWARENVIVSASADKTVGVWDANRGRRISRLTEHSAIVNSCACAKDVAELFVSGSDDKSAILWDTRMKRSAHVMHTPYQVTSVALSHNGQEVYTGGIDNIIRF
jgi:Prp8 binding protein